MIGFRRPRTLIAHRDDVGQGSTCILSTFELISRSFDIYQINLDKILFRLRDYKASKNDFDNINKNIEIYYEFPPLIDNGDISKKPLMNEIDLDLEVTREDLKGYNNLTYIKLH